jgi:catechol 2,3-dioxygenase-like lactoylglutathione lyase family enzyme
MRIMEVRVETATSTLADLHRFYSDSLGLEAVAAHAYRVGTTTLAFEPAASGRPFYHFALRVPRNRFAAARNWFARRAELLPGRAGATTFDFTSWNAEACYALDPGDNIVELIAHHELPDESAEAGEFHGGELLGVCELGLVVPDKREAAQALGPLGIELWDGTLDAPDRLAFMGGRNGVLILSPPGRGWMPTGRPAETHPVAAAVAGSRAMEVALPGTPCSVRLART